MVLLFKISGVKARPSIKTKVKMLFEFTSLYKTLQTRKMCSVNVIEMFFIELSID